MKNKLSKIFWTIWIGIGLLIAIIFLGAFFSAVGKGDLGGAVIGSVMLGMGVYFIIIYLGVTILFVFLQWLFRKVFK